MKEEGLVKFIVVAFVLAISVVMFFHFKNREVSKSHKTLNWKVYEDERYGFIFQIPENWKVRRGEGKYRFVIGDPGLANNNKITFEDPENQKEYIGAVKLSIGVTQNRENEDEFKGLCYKQDSKVCDKADRGTLDFGAGTGFVYSIKDSSIKDGSVVDRFIILANKRLTFSLNSDENESEENLNKINKIINSIKVSPERRDVSKFDGIKDRIDGEYKLSGVEVADWKRYQYKEAGFEFKIPKDWICEKTKEREEVEEDIEGVVMVGRRFGGIECIEKKHKEYEEEFRRKHAEWLERSLVNGKFVSDSNVPERTVEYNKIYVGFTLNLYRALASTNGGIAPSDMNQYYAGTYIRDMYPEEKYLYKSFEKEGLIGLITINNHGRSMEGQYGNRSININYTERDEGQLDIFDGFLKSFKGMK